MSKLSEEAISGILDLYNKEKNMYKNTGKIVKNKELENADLTTVYMNGFYDGEKKWKDKIKELREIDNIDLIQFKIRELLEERN